MLLTTITPREGLSRRLDVDALVSVSAEIIDRDGIGALTLTVLANALGVKPPSLYAHVNGLDDLKAKVALYGLQQFEQALVDAGFGINGQDAVRALCVAYRKFAITRPGLYTATYLWIGKEGDPASDYSHKIIDRLLQVFDPLLDKMTWEDRIHRLRIVRSALHGFVTLEQANGFQLLAKADDSFEVLIEFLLRSLSEREFRR